MKTRPLSGSLAALVIALASACGGDATALLEEEDPMVARGQYLFFGRDTNPSPCFPCHSVEGMYYFGRPLNGLYGTPVTAIHHGPEVYVVADEAYLRESIVHPQRWSRGETGAAWGMPDNYGETLSTADIDALIAYIASLK